MADTSVVETVLKRDRILVCALLALLFTLAAIYTILGVGMKMSALEMTAMSGQPAMGAMWSGWSLSYFLLVFLMWWIMMIAMMVPSVTPVVLLNAGLLRHTSQRPRVHWISLAFVAGYLVTWGGFALFAALAQWATERFGLTSPMIMSLTNSAAGGIVLIAAGAYQFTPLKDTCLSQCRSPVEFLTTHRRHGTKGAFVMGLDHGVFCVGCCWPLMILLFVGGIMNLYWIVGLAAFVALEKLTPFGRPLSRLAGGVLLIWGGTVLVTSL